MALETNVIFALGVKGADQAVALLRRFGITAEKEIAKIDKAAAPAAKGLRKLDGTAKGASVTFRNFATSIQLIEGPLGGVASRFTVLGAAVSRLGIVTGSLLLATTALSSVWLFSAKAAATAERNLFRVDAVLRATGRSAGVTRREINEFADDLGDDTLTSQNAVREAAAALLSFRKIGRDAFFLTLTAAQDLSATFGGDLRSNTVRLGRALEDPVRGLDALRRSGVSFSTVQKEMINDLVESGRLLEAQGLILDELQRQVGGAGTSEAQGLTGKIDTLGESWDDLLETVGNTKPWIEAVEALTSLVRGLDDAAGGGGLETRIERLQDRLTSLLEFQRENPVASALLEPIAGVFGRSIPEEQARLSALRKELQAEGARNLREAEIAFESERAARHEAANEKLLELEQRFDDAFLKLRENRTQRLQALADKDVAIVEGLRGRVGDERADALIARRRELEAAQIAQEPPSAAERAAAGDQKVVAGLQRQVELLGLSNRQRAIHIALSGLSASAGKEEAEAVSELAARLVDEAEARKKDEEAKRDSEANAQVVADLQAEIDLLGLSAVARAEETAARRLNAAAIGGQEEQVRSLARTLAEGQNREADQSVINSLRQEVELLGLSDRQRAVHIALSRLSATAGKEEAEATSELAARLFDEAEARKAAEKVKQDRKANADVIADLQAEIDLLGLSAVARAEETAARRLNAAAIEGQEETARRLARTLLEGQNREADQELTADLEREIAALGQSARERSIATALRRVSATAIDTERDRVRELAAELFDEAAAQEAANRKAQEAKSITEGLRTPQERYNEALARAVELNRLYAETGGAAGLSAETFRRHQEALGRELVRNDDTLRAFSEGGRVLSGTLTDLAFRTQNWSDALTGVRDRLFEIFDRLLIEEPLNRAIESLLIPANANLPAPTQSGFGVGFDPSSLIFNAPRDPLGLPAGAPSQQFGVTDPAAVAFQGITKELGAFAGATKGATGAASAVGGALSNELAGGVAESVAATFSEQAAAQAAATGLGQVATSSFQAASGLQALTASSAAGGGSFGVGSAASAASVAFLPGLAGGGRATGLSIVGEQGPELFRPDAPGTIIPAGETTRILERSEGGGQGNRTLNVTGPLVVMNVSSRGPEPSPQYVDQTISQTEQRIQEMLVKLQHTMR